MRLCDRVSFIARRGGFYLNRARKSVWVHARDRKDFEAVEAVLNWLRTGISAERLLLTCDDPRTCLWLRARYPNDNTLPPPLYFRPLIQRFFRQLRPAMILLVGGNAPIGCVLLAYARRNGVPVVRADASPKAAAATINALERTIDKIPNARDPMLDRTAPRRMDAFARSSVARRIIANRSSLRLNGWESLLERLGYPETILCLGNGPSSEDLRLKDLSYDALFRVNWRWLRRGLLTRPHMVFVGDLRTTARISSCVFGFRTIAWESEVLLRHLLLHLSLRRLEHFTYERVSSALNDDRWKTLPTNGVVMVATAVGLQPKKIVIAGMDLFRDPGGRYPGDAIGDNNYPQMHSREVEVAAISSMLAQFPGEVQILSEPLREALSQSMRNSSDNRSSLRPND
jgi:hypothetical protein